MMSRATWLRILIGGGALGLSILAGVGVGALTDGGDEGAAANDLPAAELPTEVIRPLTQGAAPSAEELDALAAGAVGGAPSTGGGGSGPRLSSATAGIADGEAVFGSGLPDGLIDAVCSEGSGDDVACAELAAEVLERAGDADADADPDEYVPLLCAGDDSGADCRDAVGEYLGDSGSDSDGAGEEEDPPVLVDLCAGPEPVPGCEDGVGGTVSLASTIPVEVFSVSAANDPARLCGPAASPGPEQAVLLIVTNQPVSVTGTYAELLPDGSTGPPRDFSTESSAEMRAWYESTPEELRAVTCAVVDRPDFGSGVTHHHVDFTATGDLDATPGTWSGPVQLPVPTTLPPAEPEGPARPPTEVTPVDNQELQIDVHLRAEESAIVYVASRDPEVPDRARCSQAFAGELGPREAIPALVERVVPIARTPGSESSPFTVVSRHWALTRWFGPGPHDVCVSILDGFEPPRVVERHRIAVSVPELLDFDVFVTGYRHADAGDGVELPRPHTIDLEVRFGEQRCREALAVRNLLPLSGERPFCSLSVPADADFFGVQNTPAYPSGPGTVRRSLLAVPRTGCPGFPPEECPTFYDVHVFGPADSPSRLSHGILMLGFRPSGTPGSTSWAIGTSQPDGLPIEEDLPRLDPSSITVDLDSDDPTGGLLVGWQADEEVEVLVRARTGDACQDPRARTLVQTDGPDTEGTTRLSGACAGSPYLVDLNVRRPSDAPRYPVIYTARVGTGARHEFRLDREQLTAETEMLPIEISYEFRTAIGRRVNEPYNRRVVPAHLRAHVGSHSTGITQPFDGRARLEMACAAPEFWNASAGPLPDEAGPRVEVLFAARLYYWRSITRCPGFDTQADREPFPAGGPAWRMHHFEGLDTRRLLRAGEATVTHRVDAADGRAGPPWLMAEMRVTARSLGPFRAEGTPARPAG